MGKRKKVVYRHVYKGDGLKREMKMRVLSGVVYMMNRKGSIESRTPRNTTRGSKVRREGWSLTLNAERSR